MSTVVVYASAERADTLLLFLLYPFLLCGYNNPIRWTRNEKEACVQRSFVVVVECCCIILKRVLSLSPFTEAAFMNVQFR
jgi:hypothetical protein